MTEDHGGASLWSLAGLRWLVLLTCAVVLVDIAAGVLTLVSSHKTDSSRNAVTAGLSYTQNMSNLMQDVLDTETAQRGYMLTGEISYLAPVTAAVKSGTVLVKTIKKASQADPILRRDNAKLQKLIDARVVDLEQTLDLFHAGKHAAALALVRTNRGNNETQELRVLTAAMIKRSDQLVAGARSRSRSGQVLATRAGIAAYAASGVLLLLMALLLRTYVLSEKARRASLLAQIEAEQQAEAKTGFLSRVSHELRTPLNAILGFGQLLEREPLEAGERETLDQMLGGGRHLLAIVDDLLDLSRVEAGELRLSVEPVQVPDVIREARLLLSRAAASAAIGVRTRPMPSDLYVRADRQRLMQVLLNLLSNAIKYGRRGGNVVIGAEVTPAGNVRLQISDSGSGIAPDDIERLFIPFERLDAASRGIEGTGLGLAVAKGLVEAMEGDLGLTSKLGAGTTVWFELPLSSEVELFQHSAGVVSKTLTTAAANGGAADNGNKPLELAAGSVRVLYVEDNPSNVSLVEKIFALRREIALSVARDGATGLALARELRPAVVLLDLHLPDISGEQVLAALLGDPETAHIPVVIVSADASPVQAKRLQAAGAAGYLTKPFDVDQLIETVKLRRVPESAAEEREGADELLDQPMVESLHMLATNPAVGPAQIAEMLTTFRHDAEAMLAVLRTGLADRDLDVVAREAHRLAGGAGAFGAGRLRQTCRELEEQARAGSEERARALDAALDELLEQTWAALQTEFAAELRHLIPQ